MRIPSYWPVLKWVLHRLSVAVACVVVAAGYAGSAWAGSVEQETLAHIARIAAIRPSGDGSEIKNSNQAMDAAWKYFLAHRQGALPVLRQRLDREIASNTPNQLLLLDLGYFLSQQDVPADRGRVRAALLRLDPAAEIIQLNQQELFQYAHYLAQAQDTQLLPFFDRAFLRGNVSVFVPQHSLTLDNTLVCAYLYGLYGAAGEAHLAAMLGDKALVHRIIETLIWLGSPDSVDAVRNAMQANRDYETFVRGVAFMMKSGGPQGRAAMLAMDVSGYDDKTQAYFRKIRPEVEAVSYAVLSRQFDDMSGTTHLDDDALKLRLDAMYQAYGKDDSLNPAALLNSTLPREYLVKQLLRIRSRMFYRISDEALDDVEATNALLNTLYYPQQ